MLRRTAPPRSFRLSLHKQSLGITCDSQSLVLSVIPNVVCCSEKELILVRNPPAYFLSDDKLPIPDRINFIKGEDTAAVFFAPLAQVHQAV